MFEGLSTALITPFRDGALDETALRDLVESKASSIPRAELRSEFRGLIDRLVSDPLAAYR